jgi:hypothetical protein
MLKFCIPIITLCSLTFSQTDSINAFNSVTALENPVVVVPVQTNWHTSISIGTVCPIYPPTFRAFWNTGYIISMKKEKVSRKIYSLGYNFDGGLFLYDTTGLFPPQKRSSAEMRGSFLSVIPLPIFLIRADFTTKLFPIPSFRVPYLVGGVGLCFLLGGDAEFGDYNSTKSVKRKGLLLALGAGFNIPVFSMCLFAETQYSMIIGPGSGGITVSMPIKTGVQFPIHSSRHKPR